MTVDAEEFKKFLTDDCGYRDVRIRGNKFEAIQMLIFTWAIVVGDVGDRWSFDEQWVYRTYEDAKKAFDEWDGTGDPKGWHVHPRSGRRRDASGREYILK